MTRYLDHLKDGLTDKTINKRNQSECICISAGAAVSIDDVKSLQQQLDKALTEKRQFKAKILIGLGFIDDEAQVVKYSDQEVFDCLVAANT